MIIYTDGSFNKKLTKDASGFASVLVTEETDTEYKVDVYYGVVTTSDYTKMWNVGGELYAASFGIDTAIDLYKVNNIELYHDYLGISCWADGQWKGNNIITQGYKLFIKKKRRLAGITFHHVRGHSGNVLNELADKYASAGITNYLEKGITVDKVLGVIIEKK